jgi:hypothetical protein
MNLEGSLESFGLPDVLALLASTKKTGALHLSRTGGAAGLIRLREGAVSAASARHSRRALASRLVAAGLLSDDALATLVERLAASPDRGLVAVVLDDGMVSYNDLVTVASEAAVDAVGDLLSWPSGSFSFDPDEPDPEPLDLRLQVAELVAEGQRRQESLRRLGDRAPDDTSVLSMTFDPAGQTTVSDLEWRLLALVDGRRQLAEVVALAGGVEHEVRTLIADLLGRQLLVASTTAEEHLAPLLRRQRLLSALDDPAIDLTAAAHQLPEVASPPPPPPVAEPEPEPVSAPSLAPPPGPASGPLSREPDLHVPVATPAPAPVTASLGRPTTSGSLAMAAEPALGGEPAEDQVEEDAAVTKSLLLRLIAGVRGL